MSDSLTQVHHKPVLGLVGGIGAGKSTVARLFASLGCRVINADEIAHHQLDAPDIRGQLVEWWGASILGPDNKISRKAIAAIVFHDRTQLQRLENLIHPRVNQRRRELREIHQADPDVVAIVEDCPLLLEKQLDADCDFLIFVEASLDKRFARVSAGRGWSKAELVEREKSQLALDIKAKRADYVVSNDDGEADCLLHVRRVLPRFSTIRSEFGRPFGWGRCPVFPFWEGKSGASAAQSLTDFA